MKHITFLIAVLLTVSKGTFSQENTSKNYQIRTVAFYNVENLFDTVNNTVKNDEASPIMELKANKSQVYWDKIDKLGRVMSVIGMEQTQTSPSLIGVAEIENDTVLRDLVNGQHLKSQNYGYVHYESPDKRGIDVGLLYRKQHFRLIYHEAYELFLFDENGERVFTRDQLLVSGYLDDELIHIIVNHWPSKRGGTKSVPYREKAAQLNLLIMKEIRATEPNAKIIVMGDFNDDPIEPSIKKTLKTKSNKKDVHTNDLYNPYEEMFKKGLNTLGYRDHINLFDQIMVSSQFVALDKIYDTYKIYRANIYNPLYLINSKGRYKGYPFRSFSNGSYTGGYSDHFPVYLYLIKEY